MRILSLHIKNIGPFRDACLDFASDFEEAIPVTIITGMNGAGKSVIIDAIRAAFCGGDVLERNIVADSSNFIIEMEFEDYNSKQKAASSHLNVGMQIEHAADFNSITKPLMYGYGKSDKIHPWIIDYWSSKAPTDSFSIRNMANINHFDVMKGVMRGVKSNLDLVNFICQTDYLRSSEMPSEKQLGEVVYGKVKEIVEACLDNGVFKYVRRSDLTPIIEQNGTELSLEKLSSGNLFLLEHLLLLLCKMYSVSILNGRKPEDITNTPGVLLIDEIETHMHPKWQKKILGIIRRFFPNLQIILTTHSPFVVASIDGARIYTCVSRTGYSDMRHIDRLPEPQILTKKHDEWQKKFDEKRKNDPNARPDSTKYGNKNIRATLDSCSHFKCFYCEATLKGDLKEIDHFKEVAIAPELAYTWSNLYLSCHNCNDKYPHNVIPLSDILDPCSDSDDEIKKNITFEDECICAQPDSEKGLQTIKKFRLNSDAQDFKRLKWLKIIKDRVIDIQGKMINEARNQFTEEEKKSLLRFMQRDQPYSLMSEMYLRKHLPGLFI